MSFTNIDNNQYDLACGSENDNKFIVGKNERVICHVHTQLPTLLSNFPVQIVLI